MDFSHMDLSSVAMIGGFFAMGFAAVWVFLTLRQDEKPKQGSRDNDRP